MSSSPLYGFMSNNLLFFEEKTASGRLHDLAVGCVPIHLISEVNGIYARN